MGKGVRFSSSVSRGRISQAPARVDDRGRGIVQRFCTR
jgi:hypothetical protein